MTLPTIDQARSWRGLTLVATDDEPVGKIEAIYVDRTSRQPEWARWHRVPFPLRRRLAEWWALRLIVGVYSPLSIAAMVSGRLATVLAKGTCRTAEAPGEVTT